MAQGGAAILIRGSRGVGRPKVGTDWCGMSNPLLSRSSTLNIAKVTATEQGSTSLA
jgi:hypothetical protein